MSPPTKHTPESILAAAVSVFSEVGVAASTAKVATAAGVANGTLFNYFPTKQDLIDALYIWLKSELAGAIGTIDEDLDARSQIEVIWTRWLRWASSSPERHAVMILLYRSGLASDEAKSRAGELFRVPAQLLDHAHASGIFVDLPTIYLAELMEDQLDHAVRAGLDEAGRALAFDVLWNGITATSTTTNRSDRNGSTSDHHERSS